MLLSVTDNASQISDFYKLKLPTDSTELTYQPLYSDVQLPPARLVQLSTAASGEYVDPASGRLRGLTLLGDELISGDELNWKPALQGDYKLASYTRLDSIVLLTIETANTNKRIYTTSVTGLDVRALNSNANAYSNVASQITRENGDYRILFASDMPGGFGEEDLYFTDAEIYLSRNESKVKVDFGPPINFGPAANSLDKDYDSFFTTGGQLVYLRDKLQLSHTKGSTDSIQPSHDTQLIVIDASEVSR